MRSPIGKRLAFASPELAVNLLFSTINSWLLYFLVAVIDLSPALAGLALFGGRVFDAVFDILAGVISDRAAGLGKRMLLIALSLPFALISFCALWWLPAIWSPTWITFLATMSTLVIFTLFYSLIAVPRLALLPSFAPGEEARSRQVAMDMSLSFVAVAIGTILMPLIASGPVAAPWSWSVAALILAVAAGFFFLPFLLVLREPAPVSDRARELRWRARIGPIMVIKGPVAQFFLTVLSLFLLQAMLPFFLVHHAGRPVNEHTPVLATVFGTAILLFPLWGAVARRLGNRRQTMSGLAVLALSVCLLPLVPPGPMPVLLFVVAGLCGVGISGSALSAWSLVAATAEDVGEADSGLGRGIVTSCFTFANKSAAGLALLIGGFLLAGGAGEANINEVILLMAAIVVGLALAAAFLAVGNAHSRN